MWLIGQMRSRIRYKIIGPFLILAVCTAVFGATIAFSLVANSWQERFVNQLAAVTRIANDTLVEQEQTNLIFLRQVAFAGENPHTGAPAVSEALENKDSAGLLLALDPFVRLGIADENIQLDRLVLFDDTGHSLVDIERALDANVGYVTHPSRDFSHTWFVPRVLAGARDGEDDKFAALMTLPDGDGSPVIYLATVVPVRQDDESPIVGGALLAMRLDSVQDVLRRQSQAAIVTIYDIHGEPLASTAFQSSLAVQTGDAAAEGKQAIRETREILRIDDESLEKLRENASTDSMKDLPVVHTVTIKEREYEVFYTYLIIHNTRTGILSTGMSSDYVVRGWGETRLPVLGLTLLVIVAIIVIGVLVTRQITAPLEQLVTTAGAFVAGGPQQDGQELVRADRSAAQRDEIDILSHSFKRLTEHQRRLVRRVLKDSGQRAAILESIPDGIVVCDTTGRIHIVNPKMREWLELSETDPLPVSVRDLPLEQVTEPIFGTTATDIYTLHSLILRVSRSPVLVNHNTYIGDVYVLQDLTAEVNVDRAKTNFVATISHEMRTPLTVMHGNTQLLLHGLMGELTEKQKELIATMHQHSTNMSRSLANVILVAEIDSGTFTCEAESVELQPAIEQAARRLRKSVQDKGISLTLTIPDDLPPVQVDPQMLTRIIEQLLTNARTYTDTGGITITAKAMDEEVQIDVCDTGCGIPVELVERVFDRFVRGDMDESNNRPDRGIGLGLSITRYLVEQHGGRVWIKSTLDKGTTVSFTLPYAPADAASPAHDLPPQQTEHTQAAVSQNGHHPPEVAAADGRTLALARSDTHWLLANSPDVPPHIMTLPALVTFMLEMTGHRTDTLHAARQALQSEGLLPGSSQPVPPEAVAHHLGRLSPEPFQRLLLDMLPRMHQRWQQRQRPIPPLLEWSRQSFTTVLSADVQPLDALLQHAGVMRNENSSPAKGHIASLIDIHSQLPHALWYDEGSRAHQRGLFWERMQDTLQPDTLLIGLIGHPGASASAMINHLGDLGVDLLIAVPQDQQIDYDPVQTIAETDRLRDRVVRLTSGHKARKYPVRLIETLQQGTLRRYLTGIVDPKRLPAASVPALYGYYRPAETVFAMINQLLAEEHNSLAPLALRDGSSRAGQVQVWATWLLYVLLLDMTDAVAEHLKQPADALSPHNIYYGLRDFHHACQRGHTDDPVGYLAARAQELGIVQQFTPVHHIGLSPVLSEVQDVAGSLV